VFLPFVVNKDEYSWLHCSAMHTRRLAVFSYSVPNYNTMTNSFDIMSSVSRVRRVPDDVSRDWQVPGSSPCRPNRSIWCDDGRVDVSMSGIVSDRVISQSDSTGPDVTIRCWLEVWLAVWAKIAFCCFVCWCGAWLEKTSLSNDVAIHNSFLPSDV